MAEKKKTPNEIFRELRGNGGVNEAARQNPNEVFAQIMSRASAVNHVKEANRFIVDVNKFSRAVDEDTSGENQFNAADYFEERKKQAEQLKQRAAAMSLYMNDHADSFSQESYDRMMNILSTFDTDVDDVMSRYQPSLDSKAGMRAYEDELLAAMDRNQQERDRWSKIIGFDLSRIGRDNSGDYAVADTWTPEQRYRLGMMQMEDPSVAREYAGQVNAGRDPYVLRARAESMDLEAEKREIDRLKAELDDFYWNADYDATSTNARNAFDQEVKRREKEISDRTQFYNQAKRMQEGIQFASTTQRDDFAARSGYAGSGFEVPAFVEDADPDELTYEYINDPNIRTQINRQTNSMAAKGYDLLNEEEVGIYNYYYATEGPVKAQQYLDNIQETLNKRVGERAEESKKDSRWRQYFSGFNAGYSNAVTSPQYLFNNEDDYIPTSALQFESAAIREDLADTGAKLPEFLGGASMGQVGYDLANTVGNMAPSMLISAGIGTIAPALIPAAEAVNPLLGTVMGYVAPHLGQVAGAATMGLSSAGGAYQQALNAGYSKEQARNYALLSGASEAGMEYLLGGISKLGGEIPQQVIKNMVSGVDNAIAKAAITLGGSMVAEGFEEGLQDVVTTWLENLVLYADKDVNWDEVAYSTLLGALSGGVMEGPSVAMNTNRVSGVEKQLKDLGAKENTWELAELIVKHRSGEKLSQDDYIKLVKSKPAMQILEGMRSAEPAIANMTAEQVEEMKPTTSKDGNARQISSNESINVMEFAEVKDGKASVKTDSGTVDYSDVSFGTEKQGNQYFAVESLPAIDTAHANDLLRTIQNADVGNDTSEVVAIREAYRLGYMGASTRDLRGSDANILPTNLQDKIYDIGRQQRSVNDAVRATVKAVPTKATGKYKKVVIEGKLSKMDGKRKAEIDYMDRVADTFAGTAVHVYESYEKNGKMYYRDNSGKEQLAPNGKYVNDEIWVDLNSGDKGEGLVLNTFAHEMYHHIEKWNKPKARELAEFVVKELGMQSVDKAVQAQIDKARAAGYGEEFFKGMTTEQAANEVYMRAMSDFVADSLETMFTRGDPAKAIANLKKENRGLFDQIKAFIDEWISKVKKFYGDKTISQEGAVVAQLEKFEQLQQLFMEAMQGAGENYQAALDAVVKEGAKPVDADAIRTDGIFVTDGDGTMYSIRSMKEDIAEGKMFEDLMTYCNWTQKQVDALRNQLNDLVEYMTPFRNILDLNETYGREGRRFSPYKPNSDPLYKISMDFSTQCSKRLLTQYVIENLQLRENRPMSAEEQMAIRDMLNEYRKQEKGLQVACAMCYVEAARLKSPKQMQKWMNDPETYMRNYFADKDPDFAAYIKGKQEDFKESRGYARNTPKKEMNSKDVAALNKIRPRLRAEYQPSAGEQAIIDKAKRLPNRTYLTAANLANLSESDPTIYAAYTSFVRTATRSKSLETDEPYYYGDSRRDNGNGIVVTDSFIEEVNRENGMRFSSWSDWRIQHMLDYITAVIDNAVRGAAMHGYTKFPEEVRVLGNTGMMFNMSGVAGTQTGLNEDGSLSFSETESINKDEAVNLREEFPETAGLQCIGVSDAHIVELLKSDIIDYVIPYHVSGLNKGLRSMANIHGWKNYTSTQHAAIDKNAKLSDAKDQENWHEEPVFSEFFVGYNTGMSGIDAMRASAEQYKQMCAERGLKPKFEEFAKEPNYWKLLIDRKMINQKTGELIQQKPVTPAFDFDTIKAVVDRYVKNYDSNMEARALNHIVENWDSIPKRIRDLKKQGGKKTVKKSVDNLSNQTLAAQPTESAEIGQFSIRNTELESPTDRDYLSAVDHGDMKTAQKMVEKAAKKAGYDSGMLYHGTPKFGFTWFDLGRMDDGISIFATSDKKAAESYSGETDRDKISDRELKNVRDMSDGELLKYVRRYIGKNYQIATSFQRSKLLRYYLEAFDTARQDLFQIADDNPDAFTQDGLKKLHEMADTIGEMSQTHDATKLRKLIDQYAEQREALWERNPTTKELMEKDYGDALSSFMQDSVGMSLENIYENIKEISSKETLFVTSGADSAEYLPANVARKHLGERTENGIYGLYAKTDNMLEFDAHGGAWNRIDGKNIGKEGTVTTREVAEHAKKAGYNGVKISNLRDNGERKRYFEASDIYILFDNTHVKSADPVTYDDEGNVIPISKRFNLENEDIRYSLRNQQPTTRDILSQIDLSTRNKTEQHHLGNYQDYLRKLAEKEPQLAELNAQIKELYKDQKGNLKEITRLQSEQRQVNADVNRLKRLAESFERSDIGKRLVSEYKLKEQKRQAKETRKDFKAEQKELIQTMQAEQRAIREELTGKISDVTLMEREFIRLVKKYEQLDTRTGKSSIKDAKTIAQLKADLKAEAKSHKEDSKIWEREFNRLLTDYETAGRQIARLEATIARQRSDAKAKITQVRETQEVQKQRKHVEENAKKLMKILAHPTKDVHVPMELQKPLQEFLDSIDFTSRRQASGGTATIKDIAYREALADVRDVIASQITALTNEKDGVFTLDVPADFTQQINDHIKAVKDAAKGLDTNTNRIYEMSSAELKDLSYLLGVINKAVRDIDKLHMQGEKARTSGYAKETVQEMENRKPIKGEDGNKYLWGNSTPWYAFHRYGKAGQKIFKGLMQGQAKLSRNIDSVVKFAEATYTNKEVREWERQRHTIQLDSGKTVTMSTAQIMSFWCLSHRNQAIPHMQGGGMRLTTLKKDVDRTNVQKEVVQKEHFTLTLEDLNRINNLLTGRQQEVARKLQQFMQTVGGRFINEISMARWDFMAATETDYFPIQTDDTGRDAKNPDQERTSLFALLNKSFTKAPMKNAKNALIIDSIFNVFANHMSETAEYNAFALPLVDAMKWFNYKERVDIGEGHIKDVSVQKAIEDAIGKNARRYFIDLMTDINSSQKAGRHEDVFGKILGRSKVSSVAWNTRVAIQQLSALPRASMVLKPRYLLASVPKFRLQYAVKEMQKYSGIALWKSMGYYDLNVARSVERQIKHDTSLLDQFNEKGMWLPGKMDELTWAKIWIATREQIRNDRKLSGDELLKATADLFEDVVYQTQVADSVLTRSSFMRSKSQLIKEATSFMAEPTLATNILMYAFEDYEAGHTTWDKAKRGLMIGFTGYALGAVANALLGSLSDAWRDDDEYETFWEKYGQALFGSKEKFFTDGNLFSELNPMEKFIFVKDVLSVAKGFEPHSSYSKLISSGKDLLNAYQSAMEGKGSKTTYGIVYQTLQYLSTLSGTALSNITREVEDVWNNTFGKVNPDMRLKKYNPDNGEELLIAIQKGTEEDIQRVFGRFENQQKAESALQSAIKAKYLEDGLTAEEAEEMLTTYFDRDDEHEVYWILDKWDYAKEYGSSEGYLKYGKFFEGVESGDFEAEMERLLDNGSDASEIRSQITRKYRKEYLADENARESIREKLLPVYKAAGMYEDEILEKFHDWDFEAEYGMTFSSMKAEYLDGNITEKELRSAMDFYGLLNYEIEEEIRSLNDDIRFVNKYDMTLSEMKDAYDHGDITRNQLTNALVFTGMTQKEAKQWVIERDIENRLGIDYAKLDDAYKHGDISRQTLYNAMIEHGATKQEADEAIIGYDWLKKNVKKYPDLTISDAKKFAVRISSNNKEYTLTDFGVKIDDYIEYSKLRPECKGVDNDGDGKADDGTKRDEIFRMIDSLPISSEAKDGLAMIDYGMKSIRKNAPWHKK